MKSLEPERDVFTQDYIFGDKCSTIVIELSHGNTIALTPLEYKSPSAKEMEAFLGFKNKFDGVDNREVLSCFVTDEPRYSALQKAAVAAIRSPVKDSQAAGRD